MIVEDPDNDVLEDVFLRSLNMASPVQARKWLSLLVADADTSFRIKPNLTLDRDTLGFSFSSNRFGLRGPCNPVAPTVIFGTSYAMGFAVDDGKNWYDEAFSADVMNLGFPVGLCEFEVLFRKFHQGPRHTAVFLYYPNIWSHTSMYVRWRASGKNVFDHFGWDTSLAGALEKTRQILTSVHGAAARRLIIARIGGKSYLFNPYYGWFDLDEKANWTESHRKSRNDRP